MAKSIRFEMLATRFSVLFSGVLNKREAGIEIKIKRIAEAAKVKLIAINSTFASSVEGIVRTIQKRYYKRFRNYEEVNVIIFMFILSDYGLCFAGIPKEN